LIHRQRTAVSVSFLAFGVTVGGLIPRVPGLKDHLHLTDGQVGLALLGMSLGGVTGALVSRTVIRRGARSFIRVGTLALCAAAIGPGLAANLIELMASLFFIGFFWGFIDVLENALGAQLERDAGKPLINGLHGFWSLGAFAGSLVAGGAALVGIAPLPQFIATGLVVGAGSAWFLRRLPDLGQADQEHGSRAGTVALTAAVLGLIAMGFAGVIAEGGTSDWSALFLREVSHANPGVAAAGFSGFSIAAMLVRLRADLLTARMGQVAVARFGAVMAVGGLALAIAVPALPSAVAGFTLVGMGTAVILPLVFAAGANLGHTGTSLAIVMAAVYTGTIAGPPLIGAAADHFGLRLAMAIPLVASVAVLLLAGGLSPRPVTSGLLPVRR
jgi:MFS family permease